MNNAGNKIYEGKIQTFLVCDNSLSKNDSELIRYLTDEGFRYGHNHGNYGCPWIYVDISRKLYACGMPGVALTDVIGGHAITADEFRTIYSIYKKYEGKETFVFHSKKFDYDFE